MPAGAGIGARARRRQPGPARECSTFRSVLPIASRMRQDASRKSGHGAEVPPNMPDLGHRVGADPRSRPCTGCAWSVRKRGGCELSKDNDPDRGDRDRRAGRLRGRHLRRRDRGSGQRQRPAGARRADRRTSPAALAAPRDHRRQPDRGRRSPRSSFPRRRSRPTPRHHPRQGWPSPTWPPARCWSRACSSTRSTRRSPPRGSPTTTSPSPSASTTSAASPASSSPATSST